MAYCGITALCVASHGKKRFLLIADASSYSIKRTASCWRNIGGPAPLFPFAPLCFPLAFPFPSPFPSPLLFPPLILSHSVPFPSPAFSNSYLFSLPPNPARWSRGAPQTHFDSFTALKTHLVAQFLSRLCATPMTVLC